MRYDQDAIPERSWRGPGAWTAVLGLAVLAAACDTGPLEVNDPTVLTPDELEGPEAVSVQLNGMIRGFQEAHDSYLRYATYLSDEMIATGTITDRTDVDFRDVANENVTLTNELYEPMQTARVTAEELVADFTEVLDDEAFAEVRPDLLEGIALGNLNAGFVHVLFAELYCRAVVDDLGPALSSDEVMAEALGFFEAAVSAADDAGRPDVATAARVGMARVNLWLGDTGEAAALAADVPTDFVYLTEYSSNTFDQSNELMQWTWGQGGPNIRWTVGDGTAAERDNERFALFDEWAAQGLIDSVAPGMTADNAALPVSLQLLYDDLASDIVLASGWEARMIEVEATLRGGEPEVAEDMANDLLTDPAQAANPMLVINPDLASSRMGGRIPPMGAFDEVDFTGDLAADLEELARARTAGLWLSGERQGTFRRFAEEDGVDLFPQRRGEDVCLPVPQQEIDNNPNL